MKIDEGDFLRLALGERPSNSIQAKVNQLHEIGPLSALISKLSLSYYWLTLRRSIPTYEIKNIDPEIRSLRYWPESKVISLRYHFGFFRDSLSRVIPLDQHRVERRGRTNAPIRNELNLRERQGYTVEKYQDESAQEICEGIFLNAKWRSWNLSTKFPQNFQRTSLKVVVIRDSNSRVVTINAAWVSGMFAENFYYCSHVKGETRLLAAEALIEFCFKSGAKYFRTDNLLELFRDTYKFQHKLGYVTCNIKWS